MRNSCHTPQRTARTSIAAPIRPGYRKAPSVHRDRHGDSQPIDPTQLRAIECAPYFAVKTVVDRTLTALLMIVALPLMFVIAMAILLVDGWPIFYRQTRVGKNGRIFRIWKFRTMCRNAERATGAVWSSASDPRVTALGRWLRCSHLDELPQFFNVLIGDMNLIGPRPERPEFVRELISELPRYAERLNVRPGITGLAQLRFGYDQSLADVKRKALLDSVYVQAASLPLDSKILVLTLPYIIRQVLRNWRAGRQMPNRAGHLHDISSDHGVPSPHRRPTWSKSEELRPHLAFVLESSVGFCTDDDRPEFGPRSFGTDTVARAVDGGR
jgi:lipopolysaccharide/colanic/teichoic acid biosynthesis glycosyltransferase